MNEPTELIVAHDPPVLLQIVTSAEPLVSVMADGTVIIHKEGNDKAAAKMFYESLQFEGKTLHQRIAELKKAIDLAGVATATLRDESLARRDRITELENRLWMFGGDAEHRFVSRTFGEREGLRETFTTLVNALPEKDLCGMTLFIVGREKP